MRKTLIIAGLAITIGFLGCGKIKQLFNINVDIPYNYQTTVPAIQGDTATIGIPGGGATLSFPSVAVATNSQQYIQQYGTAVNLILNVYLKSMAVQIQAPTTRNFDFMDNIDVYISSKTQPEVNVAFAHSIPKGSNTLNLVTDTTVNLKNYFIEDTIYFRLKSHINAVPPAGEDLNIATVFHMLANPLE